MIPTEESSPKTQAKVPQVASSVNKMHKLITDTENSVESLEKRLIDSVLLPEPVKSAKERSEETPGQESLAPLAAELNNDNKRIAALRDRIKSMIYRLEV